MYMILIYDISKIRTQTQTHLFVNHLISTLIVSLSKWLISSKKISEQRRLMNLYTLFFTICFFFYNTYGFSQKSMDRQKEDYFVFNKKEKKKKKVLFIVLNNRISECAWMSQKYSNCIEFSSKEEILWTISW